MSEYVQKFNSFITNQIRNQKNINIVEFGVKRGKINKNIFRFM